MIRLFGVLLVFLGSGGMAALLMKIRRRELQTIEELLYVLHRMEREIRCEGRGLFSIFSALAEEAEGEARRFFVRLLQQRQSCAEEPLAQQWDRCVSDLSLPREGERLWRELGRRLSGDKESVEKSLLLASEALTALQQSRQCAVPEERRVVTALCLSAAAFLSIVLL